MDDKKRMLSVYMKRIEALLEESYSLKRTRESWARHVEIQAEIMNVCRKAADLHGFKTKPYWMNESNEGSSASKAA